MWSRWRSDSHCQHVCSSSSPSESTPALPTLHCSFGLDLGQTGRGINLPQRQPRSQEREQPPHFLQPQCSEPQPEPTPHCSLELDLGRTQQRKGSKRGLLLSRTMNTCTGGTQFAVTARASLVSAITSFKARHTPRATEPDQAQPSGLLLQQLGSRPHP